MAGSLRSLLPRVYGPLLPSFFDVQVPDEKKATCSSCAMCPPVGNPPTPGATYFRPDAKCCTYHPVLPNYLVGAILSDERPEMAEGRARILARIGDRRGVSPAFLGPPRKTALIQRGSGRHGFGRALTLLCPYFEQAEGLCTVWPYREAVCSTYFCKYVDQADGQNFWQAIRNVVGYIERRLSVAAALALIPDFPPTWTDDLTLEDIEDRQPLDDDYAALWKGWIGREAALYVAAHAWVRGLDAADVTQIVAGPRYDQYARLAVEARDALASTELPERLVLNKSNTWEPTEGGFRVSTYSAYDTLHGTPKLHAAISAFDTDETVAEVRARLLRDKEIDLPEEIILTLYRYRVLVPPPARRASESSAPQEPPAPSAAGSSAT